MNIFGLTCDQGTGSEHKQVFSSVFFFLTNIYKCILLVTGLLTSASATCSRPHPTGYNPPDLQFSLQQRAIFTQQLAHLFLAQAASVAHDTKHQRHTHTHTRRESFKLFPVWGICIIIPTHIMERCEWFVVFKTRENRQIAAHTRGIQHMGWGSFTMN